MTKYPQIKFIVDYKKDIGNCLSFLRWHIRNKPHYLKMLLPEHLHFILKPGFSGRERRKIIRAYTHNIFSLHQREIKYNVSQVQKAWLKIAPAYFQLMANVFKGHPWPRGNYRGVASIYNMFPRYIVYKIFFFPPNRKKPDFANKTIAHEMTHFIFFDYLAKKYKLTEDSKIKGKPEDYIWLVSEIFNYTLEGWAPYVRILKNEAKRQPYFGEIKLCQQMRRDWQKKQDLDWLLDKWFK